MAGDGFETGEFISFIAIPFLSQAEYHMDGYISGETTLNLVHR